MGLSLPSYEGIKEKEGHQAREPLREHQMSKPFDQSL